MTNTTEIEPLREAIERLSESRFKNSERPIISTGISALDRILPNGGLRRGSLLEWLTPCEGSGAGLLALLAARKAMQEAGMLVVIDREGTFYPTAAAAVGINLQQTLLLQPKNPQDELWAFDQALRCDAVAAVWGFVEYLDWRVFRRLQLAAESQNALGLLIRSSRWRGGDPSWSEVQFLVEPRPSSRRARRMRVELTRGRRGVGSAVELEIDEVHWTICEVASSHATHPLPLVPELADSTPAAQPA